MASNNAHKNYSNNSYIVGNSLILSIVFAIILCIIAVLLKPLLISLLGSLIAYQLLLTLLPAVILSAIYTSFRGYLWGNERYFSVSIVEIIEVIAKIIIWLILIKLLSNINQLIAIGISISLSCAISTIVGVFIFIKNKGKISFNKKYFKPILKSALPLTAVRFISSITQPIISFILLNQLILVGFLRSQILSQIGIVMGMVLPVVSIPSTIIGALSMALIPKISISLNQNNLSQLKKELISAFTFCFMCIFGFVAIYIALGNEICMLLFDNELAGTILKSSAIIIIPMCLSMLSTSILNALNLEMKSFRFSIYSSLIMIVCIILLPKFTGIYSFIITLGIGSTLTTILNLIAINKTIKINYNFLNIISKQFLIIIPLCFLTIWTNKILCVIFPTIISLCLACSMCLCIYLILLHISGIINIKVITSSIFRKKV